MFMFDKLHSSVLYVSHIKPLRSVVRDEFARPEVLRGFARGGGVGGVSLGGWPPFRV